MYHVEHDHREDRCDECATRGDIARAEHPKEEPSKSRGESLGQDERADAIGAMFRIEVDEERTRREGGEEQTLRGQRLNQREHHQHGGRGEDGERELTAERQTLASATQRRWRWLDAFERLGRFSQATISLTVEMEILRHPLCE
jgi:hypothetical protein